ncbi:MAG: hypothetical protein R3A13_08295 [Bdellovibrionota bacterium]
MVFLRVAFLALGTALAVPGLVYSESNQFFEVNASRNIFSQEVVLKPADNFQHFKQAVKKESPAIIDNESKLPATVMTPADELIAQYGNPADNHPVLAKEDAPKPFQAMMAAMQKGEDKLAYDYAKQYVRYIQDLNRSNMRAVGLSRLAMVREGVLAESDLATSVSPEDKKLLDEDIKEQLEQESSKTYLSQLDPATKAMLLKAQTALVNEDISAEDLAEDSGDAEQALVDQERVERFKANLEFKTKRIPVDPQGKVDILFFFEPQQLASIKITPAIEALYRESEEDENLNLMGFTLGSGDADKEEQFRDVTNASFPIHKAANAAVALGVKQTPTVVLIAQTTGESLVEVGDRSFFYLDELVKKMQGGRDE